MQAQLRGRSGSAPGYGTSFRRFISTEVLRPYTEEFISSVRRVLDDLRTKEHVIVEFIGYTDSGPLSERDLRISGDPISLSKARAQRAALAVRNALKLPLSAIDTDGRGADGRDSPNSTRNGRSRNRRVEVEFWYDDELNVLPDGLVQCPEPAQPVAVTRVFDGPSGGIPPILFDRGEPVVTPEMLERMRVGRSRQKTRAPPLHRLYQRQTARPAHRDSVQETTSAFPPPAQGVPWTW